MKIIFCGPKHSGKSVFVANLIDKLPTDAYTIIRACPDGEGTWSNNKNQKETNIVRKKGKFTKSFIDNACKAIDNQTNKIVLVDVGGVMSKENEQVFQHCDSFVVLSCDEEIKKEWIEFGEKLGLECVGALDSKLDGKEEIYTRTPYLQGSIVGLERGNILNNSSVINAMVSDIVKKSKYIEKTEDKSEDFDGTMIDDTELGFELGYGKEILTEDGTPIKNVKWSEKAIPEIYKAVQEKVKPNKPVRINGVRANFVLCSMCKALREKGTKDINIYDMRTKQYIPIKNLPKKKGIKQTEGLSYNILENKENIFMDVDITKEQYSAEDYEKCVLPQLKETKNLYLSGRMPHWLLSSISSSYNSSRVFTFQPGKGFTCISSKDEKELGKIVDGIDGIDVNQYFEDKKNRDKIQLPAVIEKQGIISRIQKMISNVRQKSKYIDKTVESSTVEPVGDYSIKKDNIREKLQAESVKQSEVSELVQPSNKSPKEVTTDEIGG